MNKKIAITAAIFGIAAVILGAFGAHGIKPRVSTAELETWQTAVQYHFYHTFALLFLSLLPSQQKLVKFSGWCFISGILLFSGSLYIMALKNILNLTNASFLGPVTPVGGLFFIAGWFLLILAASKNDDA